MGTIIIIVIIVYIFREPIFGFLGWLLEKLEDLIDFIADIKDKIESFNHRRKRNKYYKEQAVIRQQRLADIDTEHSQGNHRRVIALFREVMKDEMYSLADKMKYCHIAADSVCEVATTVAEFEEARTWTMILKKRNNSYEKEADELFVTISERGGETLKVQEHLLKNAYEMIEIGEIDTAIEILEIAAEDGNFAALCTAATIIVQSMKNEEDATKAKLWIKKIKAIDSVSAKELEKKFNESPYIKFQEHHNKASRYIEEATNVKGDKFIEVTQKAIGEWEKMYEYSPTPNLAESIMKSYILLAEEQKQWHPKGNESFDKHAKFYEQAYKWAQIGAELGSEEAAKLVESLKAKVELDNLAIEMQKKKEANKEK